MELIHDAVETTPQAHSGMYVVPSESDLRDWTRILGAFHSGSFDTCIALLGKYNYELTNVIDGATGAKFLQTFKQMLEQPGMMLI